MLCLLLALTAATLILVRQPPHQAVLPGDRSSTPSSAQDSSNAEADAASGLLKRLSDRLQHGTRAQVVSLAAAGDGRAARELATLRHNVRSLGITGLALRYIDTQEGALSTARQRALGGDAWVGQVQMSWRLKGFDRHDSVREVALTFARSDGRAGFVSARRGSGGATPLWMLGKVAVRRTAVSLVASARPGRTNRFSRLADRAVVDVRKVLPAWRGRLVVEIPADQRALTRVLGSEPGAYREIAAVTTTVDGTLARHTPVHIFVNPQVFDPLGARGSQIVMSHEATHVAVGAAFSTMPTWLLEGFADYVALAHVDLPVSVTASQILGRVRKKGPPTHLPGSSEFDAANQALGASYESAWLACRLLADTYGERRLVAFYRASDRVSSTNAAFRRLGTDRRSFTRAWRAELRRLAR